jgi:hypothetical protein
MRPRRFFSSYQAPGVDSMRAKANAITFLINARTLEHVTAEEVAHRYRLKPATASTLLASEMMRRGL